MFLGPLSMGAWTLTIGRHAPTSLTMFIDFSISRSFSCCFSSFDLVLFMSSLVRSGGWRAVSPPSAPSVPVTSPGWQQHSSFGIHLQQGKTRQNVKRSAGRHTSEEERKQSRLLSVGERNHLGEAEIAGQRLRHIRGQMNGARL